jgi:hypothetical protein
MIARATNIRELETNSPIAVDRTRTSVLCQECRLRSSKITSSEQIKPFANDRFGDDATLDALVSISLVSASPTTCSTPSPAPWPKSWRGVHRTAEAGEKNTIPARFR